MKIIGIADGPSSARQYVCTVGHRELEKFLNLYYDKLKELKVGDEVDLGKGYNHADDISKAMRATQELIKAHQPVVTAILNGLRIQAISADQQQPAAHE